MAELYSPSASPEQLAALLGKCRRKDHRALAELYRLSSTRLFVIAVRITRTRDLAEEVLQESFVNIWRHADAYSADKNAPMTWMSSIVRNRALDWLRRRHEVEMNHEHEALIAAIPDGGPGPEERCMQSADAARLACCLEQLDENQQHVIRMAFYDGLSHAELAEKMGKPLGTVKAWIRRDLIRLRGLLERI